MIVESGFFGNIGELAVNPDSLANKLPFPSLGPTLDEALAHFLYSSGKGSLSNKLAK